MRSVAALAAVLFCLAGCALAPRGFTSGAVPEVTVVDAAAAQAAHLEGRPFVIALPAEVDRDAATARFLRAARQEGAAFVSDLVVDAVAPADGRWQRCVTRVFPVDHGSYLVTSYVEPDRTVEHVKKRKVVRQETKKVQDCRAGLDAHGSGHTGCTTREVSHPVEVTEKYSVYETIPGGVRQRRTWVADWRLDAAPVACALIDATSPANLVSATIYAER